MAERLSNKEVVRFLNEAVAAMEIQGENKFSIRAYQNAMSAIDNLTTSVYDLWENERLSEIPGVGPGLEQHLNELFKTGRVKEWELKKKDLPEGMFELLVLRGVGAKTAHKLAMKFELAKREGALDKIKEVAKAGKIKEIPGFGEKSESDILESIQELKKSKQEKQRMLLHFAERVSDRVVAYLKESEDVKDAVPLGSLRRRNSTVGDIDIAVSSNKSEKVLEHFSKFPEIKDVESSGDRMSTAILRNDVQIDILVSDPDSFGSLLQHFTGSKQHNIKLRQFALEKGMSLSQYGVKEDEKLKKFAQEEGFYRHIGLTWIPPEIREGTEEIELAAKERLPDLAELKDIRGDLHIHTTDSDGVNSLEEMVQAAQELGYEYVAVTDHAPSVQNRGKYEVLGLIEAKRRQIEKLNENGKIRVLYGYEVNILKDSTLGMPDELLEKLDLVIASVHTAFDLPRKDATKRLLSAIENPLVDIIGHPTGRQINQRSSMDLDWEKIFAAVQKTGKILEINAQPQRLDLPDDLVKDAVKLGIKFAVNTDSHSTGELNLLNYGIDVARRGWCTKDSIINTLPLEMLLKILV